MTYALQHRFTDEASFGSAEALCNYLRFRMPHSGEEHVRVLYVTRRMTLLGDEVIATGSSQSAPMQPRAVIARALQLGAAGFFLAHNHPSGDSTPSSADLATTRRIKQAAVHMDLVLFDHIIVAAGECTSLKALGYL